MNPFANFYVTLNMITYTSLAMNWLLFLALFPLTFVWFRRAYRIGLRRDFSEVALKSGLPPKNLAKHAPYTLATNLIGAGMLLGVVVGVIVFALPFSTWSAWAGSTIWMKIFFDFMISRHAHFEVKPRTSSANLSPRVKDNHS